MKFFNYFLLLTLVFNYGCKESENREISETHNTLQEGYWTGNFIVQDYKVPFLFYVNDKGELEFDNNGEFILTEPYINDGDSITAPFVSFPTHIRFKVDGNQINGYFAKDDNLQNPTVLIANYNGTEKPNIWDDKGTSFDVDGNWEVYFRPNTPLEYPAIGKFSQKGTVVSGTFLKRSGDSRFLKGNVVDGNQLFLYGFGGSHISLFVAKFENDTLKGKYLPNNTAEIEWFGLKNNQFELESSDSITYLVKDEFEFNFKTLEGEEFYYPNKTLSGKPLIIQIMGTWCPNCLDETRFFKELYNDFNDEGLEIIAVSYEYPDDFNLQVERIERYKRNANIPYPILVGGKASTEIVSEDFNMLNKIVAFPTSIFINKQGEVVKILTGFNGPGTGDVYLNFKREMYQFIQELVE